MTAVSQLNTDLTYQSPNDYGNPIALQHMAAEIDTNNLINGGTVTGDLHVTGTVFANISGTVAPGPISGATITASTVNSSIIGGTTAAAGTFTTLTGTSLAVTGNISADATKLGFYGHATTVQQTGVSVTAAGIHAALVNLGLITA